MFLARLLTAAVPLLLLGPPFFRLLFSVHYLVKWDDRHLLAHAMDSDFSVAWQRKLPFVGN
jgi:hypothetical protein